MTVNQIKLLFRAISIPLPLTISVPHRKISGFKVGRIFLERVGYTLGVVVQGRNLRDDPLSVHDTYEEIYFGSARSFLASIENENKID